MDFWEVKVHGAAFDDILALVVDLHILNGARFLHRVHFSFEALEGDDRVGLGPVFAVDAFHLYRRLIYELPYDLGPDLPVDHAILFSRILHILENEDFLRFRRPVECRMLGFFGEKVRGEKDNDHDESGCRIDG